MDPKICLKNAEEALVNDDFATCEQHLRNYSEWRAKGGYEPRLNSTSHGCTTIWGDELAREIEGYMWTGIKLGRPN